MLVHLVASLALVGLRLVEAQLSQNLTITFIPATQENSCNDLNSTTQAAITFSTSSIPSSLACFNLEDLFGGTSTHGFLNQTPDTVVAQPQQGVEWFIHGLDAYDRQANYSAIRYLQPGTNESQGSDAPRSISIYNTRDCRQTGDPVQPWYGFGCFSSQEGECNALPYSVASFAINDAKEVNDRDGKCWKFAFQGAADGKKHDLKATSLLLGLCTSMFMLFS